jgi:ADP-ribose pyrophosphatase
VKIPDSAKLVFKGKIFEVFQWEQELYDGSKATFEALRRPGTIQIIPTAGEKVYLSHEEQPNKPLSFTFLGGRQEENEEPLVTAKRELLEEAGLQSSDWELLKVYESEGKIQWDTYLFVARNCQKVQEPHLDAGEKIEVKEVNWDEFLEIVSGENFWGRDIANDILRMRIDNEKLEEFRNKLFQKA